jgi:hypothetical protein
MIWAACAYISETSARTGSFDVPGALTSTAGIGALVYGFIRSAHYGWHDSVTLAMLAVAVVLLSGFVAIERRARQPILPLRLFSSTERAGAYAARALYLSGMVGFFFFTLYLQDVVGFGPALTGLAFLPATILNFPAAIMVPRLIRRFGANRVLVAGLLLGIVGLAWLSRASVGSGYLVAVALPMALIGISQGLTLSPLTAFGVTGVAHEDAGAASGAVNVAHQIGSSVGLSILVAAASIGAGALGGPALLAYRITTAFDAATFMVALALVVSVVTILRPTRRGRQAGVASLRMDTTEEAALGIAAVETP